jgi:hypothetical protein
VRVAGGEEAYVTSLPRQFKSAALVWSAARAAREIDAMMSRLPTAILEALLMVEQPQTLALVSRRGAGRRVRD